MSEKHIDFPRVILAGARCDSPFAPISHGARAHSIRKHQHCILKLASECTGLAVSTLSNLSWLHSEFMSLVAEPYRQPVLRLQHGPRLGVEPSP